MAFHYSCFVGVLLFTIYHNGHLVLGQEEMQCQGQDMVYNKTQIQDTKDCLAAANTTSVWKVAAPDLPCFGMCMLKKRGFISEDGKHVVLERIIMYIDTVVAMESAKAPLKKLIAACINSHGDKIDVIGDPDCMSFLEVGQCVRDSFMEVCVPDK